MVDPTAKGKSAFRVSPFNIKGNRLSLSNLPLCSIGTNPNDGNESNCETNIKLINNSRQHIFWLYQAIDDLDAQIHHFIQQKPLFRKKDDITQSFKGAGTAASQKSLAEAPVLVYLDRREIAVLLGVAP